MLSVRITSYNVDYILNKASDIFGAPIKNNSVEYAGLLGKFLIRGIKLSSGIVVFVNVCEKSSLGGSFFTEAVEEKIFTLRLHYYYKYTGIKFIVNGEETKLDASGGLVQLVPSSATYAVKIPNGKGKGYAVDILLPEQWIRQTLDPVVADEIFEKYYSLKGDILNFEVLDPVYHQCLKDIAFLSTTEPMYNLKLEKMIINVVDRFFSRLHSKLIKSIENKGLSNEEVDALMNAEKKLLSDFVYPPSLEDLASLAYMSQTSFSNKFKQLYGVPVFVHFQNERLKKSQQLIASGKYSVKEIAAILGFQKASSFISAFKKQYNIAPGRLLLRNRFAVRV